MRQTKKSADEDVRHHRLYGFLDLEFFEEEAVSFGETLRIGIVDKPQNPNRTWTSAWWCGCTTLVKPSGWSGRCPIGLAWAWKSFVWYHVRFV